MAWEQGHYMYSYTKPHSY